jgi:hypothetical protein
MSGRLLELLGNAARFAAVVDGYGASGKIPTEAGIWIKSNWRPSDVQSKISVAA